MGSKELKVEKVVEKLVGIARAYRAARDGAVKRGAFNDAHAFNERLGGVLEVASHLGVSREVKIEMKESD